MEEGHETRGGAAACTSRGGSSGESVAFSLNAGSVATMKPQLLTRMSTITAMATQSESLDDVGSLRVKKSCSNQLSRSDRHSSWRDRKKEGEREQGQGGWNHGHASSSKRIIVKTATWGIV